MNKQKSDPTDLVLQYMKEQNRPYSAIDVCNNLHKAVGKTALQKCLEDLVMRNEVIEKTYGKQKVYVYNQDKVPVAEKDELKRMDTGIEELTSQNIKVESDINALVDANRSLTSELTLDEAKAQLRSLTSDIKVSHEKISNLKQKTKLTSPEEVIKINKDKSNKTSLWKKRKRMAMDMLGAILENYPKPKKALYDDIGIETDEELHLHIS